MTSANILAIVQLYLAYAIILASLALTLPVNTDAHTDYVKGSIDDKRLC